MIPFLVLLGVGAIAATLLYGELRWRAGTSGLRKRIAASRLSNAPAIYHPSEILTLPAPVQRYFQTVLADGQPMIAAVHVQHAGTFNVDENNARWKPFTSTQYVVTRRPGFDWDARIAMVPGVSVRVHDAYVAGEGILHAALFGLVSKINLRDRGELAQGELLRFLAETAWYPTALLPSQGIHWDAIDDHSARATLHEGENTVSLVFHFSADGLIDTVSADARVRLAG